MIYNYNDYELLYLIREKSDEALEIMYRKYTPLIRKRILDFRIQVNHEDFFQEGLLALDIAIRRYIDLYDKTFNKYFDLILQRRFIQILRKQEKHYYNVYNLESPEMLYEETEQYDYTPVDLPLGSLSEIKKEVFETFKTKALKPKEVAKILNVDIRSVYNAFSRIKQKLQNVKENKDDK